MADDVPLLNNDVEEPSAGRRSPRVASLDVFRGLSVFVSSRLSLSLSLVVRPTTLADASMFTVSPLYRVSSQHLLIARDFSLTVLIFFCFDDPGALLFIPSIIL